MDLLSSYLTHIICSKIGDVKTEMLNYIVIPAKKLGTLSLGPALTESLSQATAHIIHSLSSHLQSKNRFLPAM